MMNRVLRGRAVVSAGMLGVLMAVTACGGGGAAAPAASTKAEPAGPKTITVWSWVTGLEKEVAAYKKVNPDVTIKIVNAGAGGAEYEKLRNALKAGSGAPDAVFLAGSTIGSFVASDSLVDLNQYGAATVKANQVDLAWNAGVVGKGAYFYPAGWGPLMYWYRKDLFDKYGIEVPKTWADFATASEKLKKADPNLYLSNFPGLDTAWAGLLWQAGQKPFDAEGTNVSIKWDGPEAQKVATYWQDLLDRDLVSKVPDFTAEWNQSLSKSQFASFFGGAWYPLLMKPAAPKQAGDWRVATVPQWDAGANASADAGLAGYSVTKQSKYPQTTADFLAWLTNSDEAVAMLHSQQSQFPSYKPALESEALLSEKDPFFGNQEVNRVFLASGQGISTDYKFGPFYDYVLGQQVQATSQALQGKVKLPAAMTDLQNQYTKYAKDQGYTVK